MSRGCAKFKQRSRLSRRRRRRTTSGASTWTYTYNKRRLPVTETLVIDGRSKTITHTYNPLGQESSLTYPSGLIVATNPNALGQPSQAGTYASNINYFANGGMSGFSYGNGIVHTLTQNARELPQRSLDQKPGSAAVLDNTYSYDQNANVASIADGTTGNGGNRGMLYDGLDRLTSTSAPNEWWISATNSYDGLDNLTSNTVGNRSYAYSYDPSSRRLSQLTRPDASIAYTLNYDAFGNVTSKGAGQDSYSFDAANRMTAVTGKESYQYDGYGRRVKITRVSDNLLDYPIYTMSGQLLADEDQRSNKSTDYINLNGSLVAKRSAPINTTTWTTNYEHTDALHSPNAETDSAGNITSAKRYTPYGEPGDSTYVQGPGYTGHVTDAATGLTYAQQRYYDPIIGRFLSVDPVAANPETGASFNRYDYANDNPYRFTDPDGRFGCTGSNITSVCDSGGAIGMETSARSVGPIGDVSATGGSGSPKPGQHVSPVAQRSQAPTQSSLSQRLKDRSSFTAEGAAAFGSGISGTATKEVGKSPDSLKGSYVVGEGAMVAATYNFSVWSSGEERSGIEFTGDPGSYLKIKLGAGLALGVEISFNPAGHSNVSVSVGGGIGEEVIFKPPVTVGAKYNIGQ